ncbi:MAG: DUF4432 family protein [Chloroflexi bacterium]|nr:DUF4432 family protein [Chloroflexota bacterium]
MAAILGMNYTRHELLQRVGDISQVAGVRLSELADGFERSVRVADVRTGSGLECTVLVDRGLDIGPASFGAAALAWRSPMTAAGPAFYEPHGLGWLRGFPGGLLTTCGLTHFGAPAEEEGQALGLHGRASYIPATHLACGGDWRGDEYEIWISGQLREAVLFGENLALRRRIRARLGESRLFIEDTVSNEGFAPTPHMMLYHFNFGFPLLDEHAELLTNDVEVRPRDSSAAAGLADHARFQPPTAGYREQVFYHTPRAGEDGYAQVALVNRGFGGGQGLGAYVRFRMAELPRLVQWKMMGQGAYVCGLEPATNWAGGRAVERAAGRLQCLAPGETRDYRLEVGVLASQEEIDSFARQIT